MPETNGFVERFFGLLKYEHLYRLEIANVVELVAAAEAFRITFNELRPHEALDFQRPLERNLSQPDVPHLFRPESVQES